MARGTRIELVRELESLRERVRQQDEKLCESQRHLQGVLDADEQSVMPEQSEDLARVRSEAAQRRIQAELRAVYDNSPVMMCVLDGNRCVRYVNRALAEYVGKTEDELRNERACGIIGCANALDDPRGCGYGSHCEDCSLRLSLFDTLQTGRSHRGVERRMTLARPEGRQEVVLQGATARIETDGEMRLLLCLEDITDRKQMEAALAASEAHLQAIFRAAPTGIGVVVNRALQEVNQRVLDMTGYRREELIGQDSRLLYPTDADYDFVGREKHRQIAERGTGMVETRWRCKDGTVINVLLSSTPLDPADHSKGVIFTALEFTDRVRMERSLRESEALLARAEEIGGIGSLIWDFASGRLTWSKGLHALCGLAPGQAADTLDGGIRQAVHPEDQERIREELSRMVAARRAWPMEFRIVRPDGLSPLVFKQGILHHRAGTINPPVDNPVIRQFQIHPVGENLPLPNAPPPGK